MFTSITLIFRQKCVGEMHQSELLSLKAMFIDKRADITEDKENAIVYKKIK